MFMRYPISIPAIIIALLFSGSALGEEKISAKTYFPASGFPQAEQRRLAHRLLGEHWLQDAEAEHYLTTVSKQLAPEDEHFVVLADTDAVNAFAYLGGLVVLYRGLWLFAEQEDGFVSVLAHELGHIKLDHVQKGRENAQKISTLATPILIAGLLVDDPEVREAVIAGSAGVISSDIVAYSRELEHEADIYALNTMIDRGRDATAMADIFARLGGGGNEYLSTHPAPARRGAYLADRLHDYTPPAAEGDLSYYLLREKLSHHGIVEREYQQSRRAALSADADEATQVIARYGLLLSATKTRDKKLGEEMVQALAEYKHPFIVRAIAENLRQRGQAKKALALIKKDRKRYLKNPALVLELFSIYERLKQYQQIVKTYSKLPAQMKRRSDMLLAVGRAVSFLKRPALSNYYLAYGYALDGDFEQAQRQIKLAEKFKGTNVNVLVKMEKLRKRIERELRLLKEKRISEEK